MNKIFKNTVLAIAVAAATVSLNAGAFAQQDPTQGRINQRELARKAEAQKRYNQCAGRALHFFRACNSNAAGNSNMTRSCRRVYHSKLENCRGLYL